MFNKYRKVLASPTNLVFSLYRPTQQGMPRQNMAYRTSDQHCLVKTPGCMLTRAFVSLGNLESAIRSSKGRGVLKSSPTPGTIKFGNTYGPQKHTYTLGSSCRSSCHCTGQKSENKSRTTPKWMPKERHCSDAPRIIKLSSR